MERSERSDRIKFMENENIDVVRENTKNLAYKFIEKGDATRMV